MEILSVDTTTKTATVEWRNKVRTLNYIELDNTPEETRIMIPVAGTVGYSGTKLWSGTWTFRTKATPQGIQWQRGNAVGGLNGKVFTPVCFIDEVAERAKSKR